MYNLDLRLKAELAGDVTEKNKNRFEVESEKEIELYLKTLSFDKDPFNNNLLTPAMKESKIREELKEAARLIELSHHIDSAFKIISSEKEVYLDKEHVDVIKEDFKNAKIALDEMDPSTFMDANLKTLLGISDLTIESIFNLAMSKFNESQYPESLSLFILISTLVPENPDYWYRSGILAQKCGDYYLALRLYHAALSIDPSFIACWIFSVECFLECDMNVEANAAYGEAKKIAETSEIDASWITMLSKLENILQVD